MVHIFSVEHGFILLTANMTVISVVSDSCRYIQIKVSKALLRQKAYLFHHGSS